MLRRSLGWLGALLLLIGLAGCGGGGPAPLPIVKTISVVPASPSVKVGDQITFTAIVQGLDNKQVVWSVLSGGAGGTITSAGVYTAPATTGNDTVMATSVVDPTTSATASITITKDAPPPPPSVTVIVTPTQINQGDPVTVKWTSTNAKSVVSNDNIPTSNVSGQMTVKPLVETSFSITVLGLDNSVVKSNVAVVTVNPVNLSGDGQLTSDDIQLNDATYAKTKTFWATRDGDVEVSMKSDGVNPVITPYLFVVKGDVHTAAEVTSALGPNFQYAIANIPNDGTGLAKGFFRAEKGQVYTVIYNTWPFNQYGTFSYIIKEVTYSLPLTKAQLQAKQKRISGK